MQTQHRTRVYAHRGFSGAYPENSMAAFLAALELGVDGLEFDVHFSKDGEMVVIHDERVDRTTNGQGLVVEHTLADLKQLDAGSWQDSSFVGERIPTLHEVLDLVQAWGKPVQLNIEIKSGVIPYPGLELNAFQLIASRGLVEDTIFSSFNHFALRDLKEAYPEAKIGLLYMEGLVDPWHYAHYLHAEALHPFYLSFDEEVVASAHNYGLAVNTFTVDEEEDMVRLQQWGVDGIFTNRPDLLLSLQRDG
jgi:glycerophosphoryl diester phosphodiesterase